MLEYVICAIPRSGSSHLCSTLSGVPGAGHPEELFSRATMHLNISLWGGAAANSERDFPRMEKEFNYFSPARREATGNGALSVKLH